MLYLEKPAGFVPEMEVVGCLVEHVGKILLLQRHPDKDYPYTRGMPAGKVNKEESLVEAIWRELFEETHMQVDRTPKFVQTFYVIYDDKTFLFHMFYMTLDALPQITLNSEEHIAYDWFSPEDALEVDGIHDLDACIKYFYFLDNE